MISTWAKGIIATRWRHLAISACGIIAATALIGTIGAFGISSGRTMTARALTAVPMDWQIAIVAGADVASLTTKLSQSAPTHAVRTVGYAGATAFKSTTGGTTQTTGAGQIVGLSPDYATTFPGQIRVLLGKATGVLLAQQTAANLHATVGDVVTLAAVGSAPFDVTVDGVVDLPNIDAMFQTIGPQQGLAATAPPDNIVMLPIDEWNQHLATAARSPGGGARLQIHATLDHANLPATPDAAYVDVAGKAKNFEVRAAGEAVVGDNLAARLNAVRQDAIFARILLLFLGLPGVVLALLLTIAMARADAARGRRDQALLGLRGASTNQITTLAFVDAIFIAAAGSLIGGVLGAILSQVVLHIDIHATTVKLWLTGSALATFTIAVACVVAPALQDLRASSVASRRIWLVKGRPSLWRSTYLDGILIAIAVAIYWHSASTGYQVVLAPEGVATASVDYTAFLAPLLLWAGYGLLTIRLVDLALLNGRSTLQVMLGQMAGGLATTVAAALSRQHQRLATGSALVALAFAFATATSVFNTTYNGQLLVDARLTNGADVTVTGTASSPASDVLDRVRALPGIVAAQPMQHRFAYVGKDLQDLYGVDVSQIGKATDMVDAYFGAGGARATLARLAVTPDGVLVSQETVTDFQLSIGDVVNLRLRTGGEGQPKTIPFHFVGVVKEFPTAPRDSFLVANAAYVAAQTGDPGAEIVLIKAVGDPPALAASIRDALGSTSSLKTTDVSQTAHLIGSTLTAVDLGSLGRIELTFAVLFVAMATGLTLWLGQAERARTNAILLSLGATQTDVRSFLWGEAGILLGFGLLMGAPLGAAVAWMLVRLLSGVFDPPPEALAYPWAYLGLVLVGAVGAIVLAVFGQGVLSKEWAVRELRAGR